MGQLRDRMEQDLKLKGVSPATIRNYLLYCRKFAAFYMRSPEELGVAEIRAFLLHQIEVEQLAYASYRQVYAALKFLYSVTLGRPGDVTRIPFPKRQPSKLPKVLTVAELTAFFAALRKPKYRALFMTCYAAGLRLGEACHVRIEDIDSQRMVLRVRASLSDASCCTYCPSGSSVFAITDSWQAATSPHTGHAAESSWLRQTSSHRSSARCWIDSANGPGKTRVAVPSAKAL